MYEPYVNLDSGTKAYFIAVYFDFYPCILTPIAVIYGAPSVQSELKSYLMPIWNWIIECKQKLLRENVVPFKK